MAEKECRSVGKGRGKVLLDLGVGEGWPGGGGRDPPRDLHPPRSTELFAWKAWFAGCPYKNPFIQPTNIYGAPTKCQAQWGWGARKYMPHPWPPGGKA